MQNPVTSIAWLTVDVHLLAPLVSLLVDTKILCQQPLHSKVLMFCTIAYCLLGAAAVLIRPEQQVKFLKLYNFSQSFRLEYAGLGIGNQIAYTVCVHSVRRLLEKMQRNRVNPA